MASEQERESLPSHSSAAKNDVQKLAKLVNDGAELVTLENGRTVLHAAARAGSNDTLKWILDNNLVSPLTKDKCGNTAAHYAAVYGHIGSLKMILMHDPSLSAKIAEQVDETGFTILSLATAQGDEEMVDWILESFPSVVEVSNANGDLCVHFAASQGYLEVLKLIVKKCGKGIAERQDAHRTKPVYFAAQEGKIKILNYLVNELNVDAEAKDGNGNSTVHAAAQAGKTEAVKWLIGKLGPKYILDKTIDGATPLHMAAALGHTEILNFFLEHLEDKNDINVLDHIHATPAHDAAEYGHLEAMLLLLKHGANINIKDTENKTPFELAQEQNHVEVTELLSDYRQNGAAALLKYEKKKRKPKSREEQGNGHVRTSRQEAAEISSVISAAEDLIIQRKEQNLRRQESYQKMNVYVDDEIEKLEDEKARTSDGSHKASNGSDEDVGDDIEHHLGPQGDIYARPKKPSSKPSSEIDEFMNTSLPHRSSSKTLQQSRLDSVFPMEDKRNGDTQNFDTASNYSRPSRVRRFHDTESEGSFVGSSVSHPYRNGHQNIPGFYPPYPFYPYPQNHMRKPKSNSGSSIGSRHSSRGVPSQMHPAYPMHPGMQMPYFQPGYHPHMMNPYYPYPQHYPPYGPPAGFLPRTTEERMHMAALQQGRPPNMPNYPNSRHSIHGRREMHAAENRKSKRPPRIHTDQEIGYGPTTSTGDNPDAAEQEGFHPPAPPVTTKGGDVDESQDLVNFDSNFIMVKKTESQATSKHGETKLNPAKPDHRVYDGRWDKYIMTDSEDEHEVDEQCSVACAAESAAIVVLGCVAGLKGMSKARKGKQPPSFDTRGANEKSYLSSAWDENETQLPKKGGSRRGSISGLDDPSLIGVSPEEFANREELKSGDWNTDESQGRKKGKESTDQKVTAGDSKQLDSTSIITDELRKQSLSSVSKQLEEKILSESLGGRNASMLNIATSSIVGSRVSLNQTSDEDDDDDDFDDAISMVTGERKKYNIAQVNDKTSAPKETEISAAAGESKEETKPKKPKNESKESRKSKKSAKRTKEGKKSKRDKAKVESTTEKSHKDVTSPSKSRVLTIHPSPKISRQKEEVVTSVENELPGSTQKPTMKSQDHIVSVSVEVKNHAGVKEVENTFPESESEDEVTDIAVIADNERTANIDDVFEYTQGLADELEDFLENLNSMQTSSSYHQASGQSKTTVVQEQPSHLMEIDETARDIFGDDQLAELNDALAQLHSIRAPDKKPASRKIPASVGTKQQKEVPKSAVDQPESQQNVLAQNTVGTGDQARLLTIVTQQQQLDQLESSSSHQLLESKILEAQERQTVAMQRKFEEQSEAQKKDMQVNFQKMEEQLKKQNQQFERLVKEDLKQKRKRHSRQQRVEHDYSSDESENEFVHSSQGYIVKKAAVKTMKAEMQVQSLLSEDSDIPPFSRAIQQRNKRRQTEADFANATRALQKLGVDDTTDDDDIDEMQFQHLKAATVHRAEIKTQDDQHYTPLHKQISEKHKRVT